MCPETNISADQSAAIYRWIKEEKKAEATTSVFNNFPVNVLISLKTSHIDGEPLVIFGDKETGERKLFCSRRHAQELEKAGIVKFPETPIPTVKTDPGAKWSELQDDSYE